MKKRHEIMLLQHANKKTWISQGKHLRFTDARLGGILVLGSVQRGAGAIAGLPFFAKINHDSPWQTIEIEAYGSAKW